MSEFRVEVVEIGEIRKHENADSLSIVHVHGGYPCIIKTGEFKEGDKAVYIPIDSLLPLSAPRFAFLRKDDSTASFHRLKAVLLRGTFSMGLLVPADPSWQVGQNVQAELGITKYEPPAPTQMDTDNEHCPFPFPTYTDIEGLRRWPDILQEGENVIITEKIHGCNALYLWHNNRLWVGSHRAMKKLNADNVWWRIAFDHYLDRKLPSYPDTIFYAEVFGWVQDLRYGARQGELFVRFFDVRDIKTLKYLHYHDFLDIADALELPTVPRLYEGSWHKDLLTLAEGPSNIITANHVREGFVVKPTTERFDDRIGRVILKQIGEGYLTRKGG